MEEIWKDINGFNGKYQISNKGNIKSFARYTNGIILKPKKDRDGYLSIKLSMGARGLSKEYRVHRLVAQAFIPNNNPLYTMINHINGVRDDNRVENLEWCDNSMNQWHRCHINNNPPNNEYKQRGIIAIYILTNEIKYFNSIKECANYYDVTESAIQRRLKGKISNPTIFSKKSKLNYIRFDYDD